MRRYFLAVVFLVLCPLLFAQETLNNDGVIKMEKSGLSDDLIISTVKGSPGIYDTTAAGLATLKTTGVSEKVISAILEKASATEPSAPTGSGAPSQANAQIPSTDKATIYAYRPGRMLGAANHWQVFSNGDYVGALRNSTYVKAEASPGAWTLSGLTRSTAFIGVSMLDNLQKNAVELHKMQVEAGKTYYLRMDFGGSNGIKFDLVDEAQAKKDMSHCHLADKASK
jgi:hypothetical protein